jgi:hypothetical protein
MQRRVHALAAFRSRLVGKPDDLGDDLARGHHNLDRQTFDALKCNRAYTCDDAEIPCVATFYTKIGDQPASPIAILHRKKNQTRTIRERICVLAAKGLQRVAEERKREGSD